MFQFVEQNVLCWEWVIQQAGCAIFAFVFPTTSDDQNHAPDDHQDGMQPPYPPKRIVSVCVSQVVSLHTETPTPQTHENR